MVDCNRLDASGCLRRLNCICLLWQLEILYLRNCESCLLSQNHLSEIFTVFGPVSALIHCVASRLVYHKITVKCVCVVRDMAWPWLLYIRITVSHSTTAVIVNSVVKLKSWEIWDLQFSQWWPRILLSSGMGLHVVWFQRNVLLPSAGYKKPWWWRQFVFMRHCYQTVQCHISQDRLGSGSMLVLIIR
jgi:hypothetical protein